MKRLLQLICVFFGAEEFFVCFGYESSYCVLPVINGDICPFGLRAAVQSELYPLRSQPPHERSLEIQKVVGNSKQEGKIKTNPMLSTNEYIQMLGRVQKEPLTRGKVAFSILISYKMVEKQACCLGNALSNKYILLSS